jgi:hypothetical protein
MNITSTEALSEAMKQLKERRDRHHPYRTSKEHVAINKQIDELIELTISTYKKALMK